MAKFRRAFRGEAIFKVSCPHCGEHETSHVDFVNVQEDIQGRDVMTFACPVTSEIHESVVRQTGWR